MIKLEVVVILFFRAHKVTIIFHIIGINMPYFMLFNIKYLDIAIFWKPSIVFFVKTLACLKYLRTFAPLLTKSTSEKKFWRGGRVVDCGGLENRCTARYPGFESLSLRRTPKTVGSQSMTNPAKSRFCGIFSFFPRTSERHEKAPFRQSSVTKSLLKMAR